MEKRPSILWFQHLTGNDLLLFSVIGFWTAICKKNKKSSHYFLELYRLIKFINHRRNELLVKALHERKDNSAFLSWRNVTMWKKPSSSELISHM